MESDDAFISIFVRLLGLIDATVQDGAFLEGPWHVAIGKSFGGVITHEFDYVVFFDILQVGLSVRLHVMINFSRGKQLRWNQLIM